MSTEYIEIKPQEDNEYIVTITYLDMPGNYNSDNSLTVRIDLQAKDAVTAATPSNGPRTTSLAPEKDPAGFADVPAF